MLTDPKIRSQVDALCSDRPEGFVRTMGLISTNVRDDYHTNLRGDNLRDVFSR